MGLWSEIQRRLYKTFGEYSNGHRDDTEFYTAVSGHENTAAWYRLCYLDRYRRCRYCFIRYVFPERAQRPDADTLSGDDRGWCSGVEILCRKQLTPQMEHLGLLFGEQV